MRRIWSSGVVIRVGLGFLAVTIAAVALGVPVAANVDVLAVPEIDGASLTAGLGLLGAGLLWLRARRRVK